jgi:hypothetical protein
MDLAAMRFAEFAHFCGGIKPAVPRISRPLIRRPAALIALGAALRGHLAAQQQGDPDEKGHAHHQRRSQRGEIGPHGGLLSAGLLTGLPAGLLTGPCPRLLTGLLTGPRTGLPAGLPAGRAGLRSRRARAVCDATPMLNFLPPGYNRNSMRVLPSVLGFTHSRSRNSATPSS